MGNKEKILELRKNGYTINEIVKELGCAKSTVSYHINKAYLGGNINGFLFGVSDADIQQIILMRNNNKTYSEILSKINITEDKLKKICRNAKINQASHNISKIFDKSEVLEYYLKVKSLRKTASHFKTTRNTIRKYIDSDKIIVKREKTITKSQSVIDWRKRSKIRLIEYKGGKCEICGYNKSINALHFHHRNSQEKDFQIGSTSYSFERLKKESDKCIMVCSNCHCEIHEGLISI